MSSHLSDGLSSLLTDVFGPLKQVPGFSSIISYIERSYQHDPYRVALEIALFLWMVYYVLHNRQNGKGEKLTEKEINQLVEEWEPEPLVPEPGNLERIHNLQEADAITGPCGNVVTMCSGESLKNFSINNFLDLQNRSETTDAVIDAIRKYGVGACGPAGFYGSMDVHLELEKELARTLDTEDAIVYSQGFMAVASVIPAFCKRGDIIVADDGCSYAIQTGLEISRSKIYFFRHNDMEDLLRVLQLVEDECIKQKLPLSRRFIIVEGLYAKSGDLCPLSDLLRIKKQWKYRLLIDESLSFGCLGPHGKGITDYYNIPASEVEVIVGSFSNSIGSSGGFCAGSHAVVDHQRLSSQAYCFSAALPPLLAIATLKSLEEIKKNPLLLSKLHENLACFEKHLVQRIPNTFEITGHYDSPLRHLQCKNPGQDVEKEVSLLKNIVASMRREGYLLAVEKYGQREKFPTIPSIKICTSCGFTTNEIIQFSEALVKVLTSENASDR